MSSAGLRNLAIVVAVLIAVLVGLQLTDDTVEDSSGELLFAGLRAEINDIESLTVERAGEEAVVVRKQGDGWVLDNRNDYPADVAKVREVLLALADARILEEKTANPERYAALGVEDVDIEGSQGTLLTAAGEGAGFAVVIGNAAPGSNRYVRPADGEQSLLIDRDPAIPDDAGGWLATGLVDIDTGNVATVAIEHADGERLFIEKANEEDANFTVPDIPDGRDLSYPTVANSIAGALNGLQLEDVRAATGGDPVAETVFTTFDGVTVVVTAYRDDDDATWIALEASSGDADGGGDIADAINERAAGREFRIPAFRANQLTRRWEDVLKPLPEDGNE